MFLVFALAEFLFFVHRLVGAGNIVRTTGFSEIPLLTFSMLQKLFPSQNTRVLPSSMLCCRNGVGTVFGCVFAILLLGTG